MEIRIERGSKVAVIGCSNGQPKENRGKLEKLADTLKGLGLEPVFGKCLYTKDSVFGGSGEERAESLLECYRDPRIRAVFDVSGGDIANEILSFLDYDLIGGSEKLFWGYSDLTTVINAVYAKTGRKSVLYQVRNLISADGARQISAFEDTVMKGGQKLLCFQYEWIQKEEMEGIVVGGNIRCLLKLAGTPYWPDMRGKILLLESLGGTVPQMVAYLNQLQQMRVFEQAGGILLGTFTKMEEEGCLPSMAELVKQYAGDEIPIARTGEIGHGPDSKGIVVGGVLSLSKNGRMEAERA